MWVLTHALMSDARSPRRRRAVARASPRQLRPRERRNPKPSLATPGGHVAAPTAHLAPAPFLLQGVNIMMFCKEYNARTQDQAGMIIPVEITVFEVRRPSRHAPERATRPQPEDAPPPRPRLPLFLTHLIQTRPAL